MSIKICFHISKDFFDQIYSQGIEYDAEINIMIIQYILLN